MNTVAYEENQRNDKLITKSQRQGFLVLEVSDKATYRGTPMRQLGKAGMRKFENLLFLANQPAQIKFIYH